LGDYQADFEYEGEFDPWMSQLWDKLKRFVKVIMESDEKTILPPIYNVEIIGEINNVDDCLTTLNKLP
jgi:hypothetical protein